MIRLHKDWRQLLRKAWSLRLIALAALLSGAEVALSLLDGSIPLPRGIFAMLSALVSAAAFPARLIAQKDFNDADSDADSRKD